MKIINFAFANFEGKLPDVLRQRGSVRAPAKRVTSHAKNFVRVLSIELNDVYNVRKTNGYWMIEE